MSFMQRIRGGF